MAASTDVKRKERYVRAPYSAAFQPTPRQWRLLRWLAEYRILTVQQLALLSARTPHTVRQQLRGLFDANLIEVLPVNRAALAQPDEPDDASLLYGSAPNIYVPTKRGLALLLKNDLMEESTRQRPLYTFGPRSSVALAHTVLIRDARIWLERCSAVHGGAHRLLHWRDGSDAELRLSESKRLVPDAWFVYHLTADEPPRVLVGMIEADRGTERGTVRWEEKLAAYQHLFHGDLLQRNTGYSRARVLVITLSVSRRERLARLISEYDQKQGLSGMLATRFWLVEKAALETGDMATPGWHQVGVKGLQSLVGRDLAPLHTR